MRGPGKRAEGSKQKGVPLPTGDGTAHTHPLPPIAPPTHCLSRKATLFALSGFKAQEASHAEHVFVTGNTLGERGRGWGERERGAGRKKERRLAHHGSTGKTANPSPGQGEALASGDTTTPAKKCMTRPHTRGKVRKTTCNGAVHGVFEWGGKQ